MVSTKIGYFTRLGGFLGSNDENGLNGVNAFGYFSRLGGFLGSNDENRLNGVNAIG